MGHSFEAENLELRAKKQRQDKNAGAVIILLTKGSSNQNVNSAWQTLCLVLWGKAVIWKQAIGNGFFFSLAGAFSIISLLAQGLAWGSLIMVGHTQIISKRDKTILTVNTLCDSVGNTLLFYFKGDWDGVLCYAAGLQVDWCLSLLLSIKAVSVFHLLKGTTCFPHETLRIKNSFCSLHVQVGLPQRISWIL